MNQVLAILFRLLVILLGFAAACLAASGFVHLVWIGPLAADQGIAEFFYAGPVFVTLPLLALMIGYLAFFPWLIVLAIAELTGRRGWLFYALAGALIATPVAAVLWIGITGPEIDVEFVGLSVVGAGMFGSFVYWLVAGRSAGMWRRAGDAEDRASIFGRATPPA